MSPSNDLLLRACRREPVERTPVWLMRQAGRYMPEYRAIREKYSLLEICQTPELAAQVTLQPLSLGFDAAIIFADLLLPLPALGLSFHFAAGEGPVVDNPIRSRSQIEALRPVDVAVSLGYVLQAIRAVCRELGGTLPLIGFAGAPFTLASYMIEGGASRHYLRVKELMYSDPQAWTLLMSRVVDTQAEFLLAQAEAGADVLQVFDSWVGCLSPHDYRRYVLPAMSELFERLEPARVPVIHFGTATAGLLALQREAGGDVIGVDWRIRLDEAWRLIGADRAVQGNLDPAVLLAPLPELRKKAAEILDQVAGRPGHIFNLGHGILPNTPVDNVRELINFVREYSGVRG
ncbi:MAG: uroporphyrinogen decarboxylase [Acidobacteriota bacterium]